MTNSYQTNDDAARSSANGVNGLSGQSRDAFNNSASNGSDVRKAANDTTDKLKATAVDLQKNAADLANSSAEALKAQASNAKEAIKSVASQAGEKINQSVVEGKGTGADYVSNLASVVRRAAEPFDQELPIASQYIRLAADQMDYSANAIRNGNLSDLVGRAQSFARSQPTAFLALSMLAGFGVVRFLKSGSATGASGGMSSGA